MKKALLFFGICIVLTGFIACTTKRSERVYEIKHITRILMHEINRYTFLIEYPGTTEITEETIMSYNITKFKDVPIGEKMWAKVTIVTTPPFSEEHTVLEIHVRSVEDINGTGWDQGKSGRGQTTVIE